jgi:dihydroorotate dehydrogenase electron transfer subunit
MIQTAAALVERRTFGPAQELTLAAPLLARQLGPGQAVLLKCGWALDPYLRRTFYPIAVDDESWMLRIPPGGDWGHAWLRAAPIGTEIDCLGPVGTGYSLPDGVRNLLCLGQGDATWMLLPAIARAEASGLSVTLAMEAASARDLMPVQRLPAAVEYHTAIRRQSAIPPGGASTMPDGVVQFLPELLLWADAVLAVGSLDFYAELVAAVRAARFGLSRGFAQVLYPVTFLCGVGACQACTADVAGGRRRVCLRGPVFDLADAGVGM